MRRRLLATAAVTAVLGGLLAGPFAGSARAAAPSQVSDFTVGTASTVSPQKYCASDGHTVYGFAHGESDAAAAGHDVQHGIDIDQGRAIDTNTGNDYGTYDFSFTADKSLDTGATIMITTPAPKTDGYTGGGTVFPDPAPVETDAVQGDGNECANTTRHIVYLYYVVGAYDGPYHGIYVTSNDVSVDPGTPNIARIALPTLSSCGSDGHQVCDFYPAGQTIHVYVAGVLNPPAGKYPGVNYTVATTANQGGSVDQPVPANDYTQFYASDPDVETSMISASPQTATADEEQGSVITVTITDKYHNPIQGETVYVGASAGSSAQTTPVNPGSDPSGLPQTDSNGQVQYKVHDRKAETTAFFAVDVTQNEDVGGNDTPTYVTLTFVAASPVPPTDYVSRADATASRPVHPGSQITVDTTARPSEYVHPMGQTHTADGVDQATVRAYLVDRFGNPIANKTVVLQGVSAGNKATVRPSVPASTPNSPCAASPGTSVPAAGCSDANGFVQFTVTDQKAEDGIFTINVVGSGTIFPYQGIEHADLNAIEIPFVPGAVATSCDKGISVCTGLSPTKAQNLADGTSTITLTATVTDRLGNAIVGRCVQIVDADPPAGSTGRLQDDQVAVASGYTACTGGGRTDATGRVAFKVSDRTVESGWVSAVDVEDQVTFGYSQLSFVTGTVSTANSSVTATPTTVVADGLGYATVTATVVDGGGHPLAGRAVTLNGGGTNTVVRPQSAQTDGNGAATFRVYDTDVHALTLAAVDVASQTPLGQVQVSFVPVPATSPNPVTASPTRAVADGSSAITVTARAVDSTGAPIAGLLLHAQLPAGSTARVTAANGAQGATAATTGADGTATFTVVDAAPETVQVSVVDDSDAQGVLGAVTVTFVPQPDEAHESTVTASPIRAYVSTGPSDTTDTSVVTVTLEDGDPAHPFDPGTPIANRGVELTADSTTATISPASTTTGSDGTARFTVSGTAAETVTFTATDTSNGVTVVQTAQVRFLLHPDEDTTSTLTADPAYVVADGTSTSTLTATLMDHGQPLAGDTVAISQGGGHSQITSADPVSDAQGVVHFTVTDRTAEAVAYTATDLTTATTLRASAVVTFTTPPGGSLTPTVTQVSPGNGPVTGGTLVTITGTHLSGATAVRFGSVTASTFSVQGDSSITAYSPAVRDAGQVDVTVTTANGTSATSSQDGFVYTPVSSGSTAGGGTGSGGTGSGGGTTTPAAGIGFSPASARLLDTRITKPALDVGKPLAVKVAGVAGVPSTATAVVLHLTAISGTKPGYLSAYPTGKPTTTSVLNFGPRAVVSNLVVVKPAADGTVTIAAPVATDLLVDLRGWYATGGAAFTPTAPRRVVDTRTTGGAIGPKATRTVHVTDDRSVTGAVLNLTGTGATAPTYLTVAGGSAVSDLNLLRGQTVANRVVVPVDSGGNVQVYNSAGSTQAILDVTGWYTSAAPATGTGFTAQPAPARVLDTRQAGGRPVGSTPLTLTIPNLPSGARAVVLNLTATDVRGGGFVTAWPSGARPDTSDLNTGTGQTVANLVVVPVGPGGTVQLASVGATADLVADLQGYFA